MTSSVIFIGSPEHFSSGKHSNPNGNYYQLFYMSPRDLFFRILASFIPPYFGPKYRKVHVDLAGPLLGFLILTSFLVYGYSLKQLKIDVSPIETMVFFAACMPSLCYVLAKLGRSTINFYETLSLVGYSLYGHLLTLLVSFVFFHETSNAFFFASLVIFGGSSTLRLILVFLKTIPVPGARLLVCSSISLVNILYLIYLHFGFMHRTFP